MSEGLHALAEAALEDLEGVFKPMPKDAFFHETAESVHARHINHRRRFPARYGAEVHIKSCAFPGADLVSLEW